PLPSCAVLRMLDIEGGRSEQLLACLLPDRTCPCKGKSGHATSDEQVWARIPGAEYSERGKGNGEIAERIVARADPDRAHVRVAGTVAVEHQCNGQVHGKRY